MVFARIRKGGKWEDIRPKVYSGGKWVDAHTRVRVNGQWVDLEKPKSESKPAYVPQVHVGTWWATWSEGYWGRHQNFVSHAHYNSKINRNYPVQGNYVPSSDSFLGWDGIEGGMIGFDDGNIRSALKGAKINKIEIYLVSYHWYNWSGGTAVIGTHNTRGWTDRFQESNHGVARQRYTSRVQGHWITLPNWVGDNFRDNLLSGITVYADNTSKDQYGYFAGSLSGGDAPRLRITYTK